jgi:hypothetical protein
MALGARRRPTDPVQFRPFTQWVQSFAAFNRTCPAYQSQDERREDTARQWSDCIEEPAGDNPVTSTGPAHARGYQRRY